MIQHHVEMDCNVLERVLEETKRLRLRLEDNVGEAKTDEAIDAICELDTGLQALIASFEKQFEKLVYQADEEDRRTEARHNRSLRYPASAA